LVQSNAVQGKPASWHSCGYYFNGTILNICTDLPVTLPHLSYVAALLLRTAMDPAKTAWERLREHDKETEVFIRSPNSPDINRMGSDGISGKQAQSTKTPPPNPQHPRGLLLTSQHQTLQDTFRCSFHSLSGQSSFKKTS